MPSNRFLCSLFSWPRSTIRVAQLTVPQPHSTIMIATVDHEAARPTILWHAWAWVIHGQPSFIPLALCIISRPSNLLHWYTYTHIHTHLCHIYIYIVDGCIYISLTAFNAKPDKTFLLQVRESQAFSEHILLFSPTILQSVKNTWTSLSSLNLNLLIYS